MERHHNFNSWQQQWTSLKIVPGFNEVVVHTISDMLVNTVDENKITCSGIFNMDETSHTFVQRP
jgi:hypothetical protein